MPSEPDATPTMDETRQRRPPPIFSTLVLVVLVVAFFAYDGMQWIGNLPGDIRAQQGDTRISIPFTSGVALAIALAFVLQVLQRWLFRDPD